MLAFLGVYGIVAASLYLAANEYLTLLPAAVLLLPALLTALILAGAFARHEAHRRFYLGAALLPVFTLISLTLVGTLPPLTEALVSYLVLGIALIIYQQATQTQIPLEGRRPRSILLSLPLAIPLGVAAALVGTNLFSQTTPYPMQAVTTAVLVAAAVAFLDEYLFRGVLQYQIGAVSRPVVGWLAAVGLFVAFAAPSGDFLAMGFRAWLGVLLGFLVWWRRLLPLALMVRAVAAISLVVLATPL